MQSGSKNEERPIFFSSPMVKAILDGRKTMTRRVIKPQPTLIENSQRWFWSKTGAVSASREWWEYMDTLKMCPYGQTGDKLSVKETFCLPDPTDGRTICFKASDHPVTTGEKWKPSIFMPRWASRITLEIINVKVEKLQQISIEDSINEGWPGLPIAKHLSERWFRDLWDSIYGPGSWDLNPWVWVIAFRVIGRNGG